jgi:hypothetical protein
MSRTSLEKANDCFVTITGLIPHIQLLIIYFFPTIFTAVPYASTSAAPFLLVIPASEVFHYFSEISE